MRWKLPGIALGAYALGLIVMAPATLIDARLQRASEGRLRLAEAQGTLWSGSGQLEIRDAGRRNGIAKSIAWRVLPATLLRGHLVCEIELDRAARHFPVTLSLSRVRLVNADINVPAAALGLALPKLAPLGLSGEMWIHVADVSAGRGDVRGEVTLQWRAAGSAHSPVSPLGDYELRVAGEGPAVRATLHTLQGPLQLDGQGSWANGRTPVFIATARVPPEFRQRLAPFLRLFAVERGDGSFELQLK